MAKTHANPLSKESRQSNEALKGFDAFMAWATFNPWTFRFLGLLASLLVMGFLARTIPNTFQNFDERSDALTWNLSSSSPLERRLVVLSRKLPDLFKKVDSLASSLDSVRRPNS